MIRVLSARIPFLQRPDVKAALVPLVDQALVSGFGFLSGIVAARLVDLSSFGRFALAIIFSGFAQNLHNALVTSPMMSLAGRRTRLSEAYKASLLIAALLASLLAGPIVSVLMGGFFAFRDDPLPIGILVTTACLTAAQNVLFTLRRLLFTCGLGLRATWMDASRIVMFPAILLAAHLGGATMTVPLLLGSLSLSAVLAALPFAASFRPRRARRGLLHVGAIFRRHGPLARWLMPVVLVTFGQEQLVWIFVGIVLGDHALGGLRGAQYLVGLIFLLLAATENVVPIGAARALNTAGRPGLIRYLLTTGTKLGVLVVVLALGVALFAAPLLRLVFGEAFVPFASSLRLLALAALFIHVRDMATQYFRATLRTGPIFEAFVFSLVVSVVCFYPLLTLYGLVGAALVVLLGHVASMGYMLVAAALAERSATPRALTMCEPSERHR